MNNPKQLTFPWSKPNKSSFDYFYFDKKNQISRLLAMTEAEQLCITIKYTYSG